MTFKTLLKAGKAFVNQNSPTILAGLAVAGVVTTSVLSGKAAVRAHIILESHPEAKTKKDKAKLLWKTFAPPVVMGAATVGCVIGGQAINQHRNAVLAGAYALAETSIKELESKATEMVGAEKVKEIKDAVIQDKINSTPIENRAESLETGKNEVIISDKDKCLCYDVYSGRYFESTANNIEKAISMANTQLFSDYRLSMNDMYDCLGLSRTVDGEDKGWNMDDAISRMKDFPIRAQFGSHLGPDNKPCLSLEFHPAPYPIF